MTMAVKPDVVRALYRSILRAAAALQAAVEPLGLDSLHEAVSRIPLTSAARALGQRQSLQELARFEFRARADDVADGLSRAVAANTRLWGRAAALNDDNWEPRSSDIAFHVGTVATHRLHGYRMVLAGWTPSCNGSTAWVRGHRFRIKGGKVTPMLPTDGCEWDPFPQVRPPAAILQL